MDGVRLDHCVIAVSDWEQSNAFYRDVVGAEIVELSPGRCAYRLGGQQLNVHGPGSAPYPLAREPVRPGNSDLCFVWPGTSSRRWRTWSDTVSRCSRGRCRGSARSATARASIFAIPMAACSSSSFTAELAAAEIGATFNQYTGSPLLRERLAAYLDSRAEAELLLVGEAAGYRGARVSGIAFTSERQLTGFGPAEASATIVQRTLAELGLAERVLLWNLVPTHPGTARSNRRPTRAEIRAARPFLERLADRRRVIPVGRLAQEELGGDYVRHPARGGAAEFRAGLLRFAAGAP